MTKILIALLLLVSQAAKCSNEGIETPLHDADLFNDSPKRDESALEAELGAESPSATSSKFLTVYIYYEIPKYNEYFNEMKEQIEFEFPQITVQGEAYPVPEDKQNLSSISSVFQSILIGVVMLGESILQMFKVPVPETLKSLLQKRFMLILAIWFLGNSLRASLTSTGAFEISLENNVEIYSKIKTTVMPEVRDILKRIHNEVLNR